MRKICAWLCALAVLLTAASSLADGLVMAGYEGTGSGRRWEDNKFFSRMAERTGLSFTFRQFDSLSEYNAWVDSLTKDSDLPDVLFKASLSDRQIRTLYERGVLIDLKPYLAVHAPHLWALLQEDPDAMRTVMTDDGAIPTLPMIDPIQANNVFWINEVWLRQLNLSAPATAEELTEVLRAFRDRDPNRNARKDEIPLTFSSMWDLRFLQHAYGIITNDYYQYTDEDGRVGCPLLTKENREWLAWMHGLWEEGLLDRTGFTAGAGMRKITDKNAAIPYGVICGPTPVELIPAENVESFTALQPLTYGGRRIYRSLLGSTAAGTFAVTSRCEDPAAVLAWVDFLYTEEGYYLAHVGKQGEEYTMDGDGTWLWNYDVSSTAGSITRRDSIIGEGSMTPGWIPTSGQMAYRDSASQKVVADLTALSAVSREACPQVSFTEEERAELRKLWPPISRWCEEHMTWFVTGDVPLNEGTWEEFIRGAEELGMPRVTEIWQQAVDRYYGRDAQ